MASLVAIRAALTGLVLWPWTTSDLSYRSIAIVIVGLILTIILLCIASIIAVPFWIAWLTDSRATSISLHQPYTHLRPIDLTAPREAMSIIKEELIDAKPAMHYTSEAVAASLDHLISLIMRDFVNAWHEPLLSGGLPSKIVPIKTSSSRQFPDMVEQTIRRSLSSLIQIASHIDLPHLGMCKLLPILTHHIKLFEEAEAEWRRSGSAADITEGEEGDLFMVALYNNGRLHPAVGNIASPDTKLTELDHLRKIAERAMKHVLPHQEAKSNGVNIVIRELIACVVLKSIVDSVCDPDVLNALLEEKAGAALQEQKLVSKLREALDKQGSSTIGSQRVSKSAASPLSPTSRMNKDFKSSETSFGSFLNKIHESKSILEVRKIRNGLLQQIRKTKVTLTEQETLTEAKKKDLKTYLQRLQGGLEAVDYQIQQLRTSTTTSTIADQKVIHPMASLSELAEKTNLRDVLTSPSAISSFLEFTESRNRSIFVQFWLSVNLFKNPLEVVESDSEEENELIQTPNLAKLSSHSLQLADEEEVRVLKDDLSFFVHTYYESPDLTKVVKAKYIQVAKDFVKSQLDQNLHASTRTVRQARRSVLLAQKQVYEDMLDEDWPAFQKSQLWHQTLEALELERAGQTTAVTSSSSFILERDDKGFVKKLSQSPITSRVVSHAHLFGPSDEVDQDATSTAALFAEDDTASSSNNRLKAKTSLDQLMGGKGVAFEGVEGRTPLFREALFEEDDPNGDCDLSSQIAGKEAQVQIDQVDAIEDVLSFLIQADLPPSQIKSERPTLSRKSTLSIGNFPTPHSPILANEGTFTSLSSSDFTKTEQILPPLAQDTKIRLPNSLDDLARIDQAIRRLEEQETLLAALIRKSDLTGSSAKEMRLLEKSKNTIARELRELRFEKTTVIAQQQQLASHHVKIIPGLIRIGIKHAQVNHDSDGKEFATYLVEIGHLAETGNNKEGTSLIPQSGWIVSRRYNEFYILHNRLKEKFNQVRGLESVFPGKRLTGMVSPAFLESRRLSLQRYLQQLVKWDSVCRSREFKAFLSQTVAIFSTETMDELSTAVQSGPGANDSNMGLVSRLYRGVTGVAEGMDDLLFGPSMYEVIVHRLSTGVVDLVGFTDVEKVLAGATTSSVAEIKEATQAVNKTSFTGPLCDAIIEIFQLKLEGNWFRKQAVIIVAQQALGDTIERKVRQAVATALQPNAILHWIAMIQNAIWPNGILKTSDPKRTLEEKRIRRENALKKLSTLIPSECIIPDWRERFVAQFEFDSHFLFPLARRGIPFHWERQFSTGC